jgi:hypothetical protein
MTKRPSIAVSLAAAAVLIASGLAANGPAQAKPRAASTSSSAKVIQHSQLTGSTHAIAPSVHHTGPGALNLSEDGKLQQFVNRSNSPRPAYNRLARRAANAAVPWLPTVTPTAVNRRKPNAVTDWEGLNENDNEVVAGFSLEPPDQGLCVGQGHVLEMINDVVQVFTPRGNPETSPIYLNDFFQEPAYQFTTDPSCVFDAGTRRFFATQLTLDVDQATGALTGRNWLDVAVSKTSDPTKGYRFYRIFTTDDGTDSTPSHTDCPCIGDYPHLGTDANGLFLTTNEYPFEGAGEFGNEFNGAQVYALSKRALVSGASSVPVVHFENVTADTTSGSRLVGFTLRAALSAGTAYDLDQGGTINFASSFAAEEARPDDFTGHASQVGYWWIQNTRSLDTASPSVNLRVKVLNSESYGIPPLSNQKPGPVPLRDCLNTNCAGDTDPYAPEQEGGLDSSDTRIMTAVYAAGHVYSALDTSMQVSDNVQAGPAWFDMTTQRANSTLAGQGYLGATGANLIMPAFATDPSGVGYAGMTLSGNDYYPSAAYATFHKGFGSRVHVAGAGAAPEDGFCEYLFFNCADTPTPAIRPRWGDYGYAAWDGSKFYLANEYIAHSCSFATFANDFTCGGTRTYYGNFSTHIQVLSP